MSTNRAFLGYGNQFSKSDSFRVCESLVLMKCIGATLIHQTEYLRLIAPIHNLSQGLAGFPGAKGDEGPKGEDVSETKN